MSAARPFRTLVCQAVVAGTPHPDLSPDEKKWCVVELHRDGITPEAIADTIGISKQHVNKILRTTSQADIDRITNVDAAQWEQAAQDWEHRVLEVARLAADVRDTDPYTVLARIKAMPARHIDNLLFAALTMIPDQERVPLSEIVSWAEPLADIVQLRTAS